MSGDATLGFRGEPVPCTPATLQLLSCAPILGSVLGAALDLRLFDHLAAGPLDAEALAARAGVSGVGARRLLTALVALGLVEQEAGPRFRNGPLAAAVLTTEGEDSLVPFLQHQRRHVDSLFAHLGEAVASGRPQFERWPFVDPSRRAEEAYTELSRHPDEYALLMRAMDIASRGVGRLIAEQVDFTGIHRLVDLGGGGGQVALELAQAVPHLSLELVDTPPARAYASERIARAGLTGRIRCTVADLREDLASILEPADALLLSGVIGDFVAEERARILSRAVSLLRPGGLLLVSETLFHPERRGPLLPALLSLFMLLSTGGDNFTPEEMEGMLRAAGLSDIRLFFNGARGLRDLAVGRRPIPASEG
ncbi:acetylserotonin O-methyltransferase [Archangium lipolyticum]|uniref:acetylserotonin O-methyltransferase n=1 Tax=Archangium lipolyticum TaxID=2970465 RepID=UPI002149EEF7|nr:acetylserotonin O-methyltransferase [Archangium lipolyticum]